MAAENESIRSIKRGLEVLQVINRAGLTRLQDISNATGLPYPTVCRIVDTFKDAGMIERDSSSRNYRPTALVRTLSVGFQEDEFLVTKARKIIEELCSDVGWPITIATRVGNHMMIRDSTHKLTTLTFHNYAPGYTLPLLECSVGKAYLAFCPEIERKNVVSSLDMQEGEVNQMAQVLLSDDDLLDSIRKDGFATHAYNKFTSDPGRTSSLGVPIFDGELLAGALGLVFFSSTMSVEEAAEKYVAKMQATSARISEAIAQEDG